MILKILKNFFSNNRSSKIIKKKINLIGQKILYTTYKEIRISLKNEI